MRTARMRTSRGVGECTGFVICRVIPVHPVRLIVSVCDERVQIAVIIEIDEVYPQAVVSSEILFTIFKKARPIVQPELILRAPERIGNVCIQITIPINITKIHTDTVVISESLPAAVTSHFIMTKYHAINETPRYLDLHL
jgi:hypothetical protein